MDECKPLGGGGGGGEGGRGGGGAALASVDFAPFLADVGCVVGDAPTPAQLACAAQIDAACRDHGFLVSPLARPYTVATRSHFQTFQTFQNLRKRNFPSSTCAIFSLRLELFKLPQLS